MFLAVVLYYCDLFFGLHPSSLCFVITTFRGMALPSSSGEPNLLGPSGASIIRAMTEFVQSYRWAPMSVEFLDAAHNLRSFQYPWPRKYSLPSR
jgi:hypothetical protein